MKDRRNKNFKKGHEEKGFVLIMGIIIMTFLLLLVVPFLFQLSFENRNTVRASHSLVALSLAEAGIERGIWELNYGDISGWEGNSSLRKLTISDFQSSEGKVIGDIVIRIQDPAGENPVIEAMGTVVGSGPQPAMRIAQVVLKRDGPPPIFDFAVFGGEGVDLNSNALIDSYDSRKGAYGGLNVASNGNVATNATDYGCIDLSANAKIYGSAYSGPNSDPSRVIITRSNALISGVRGSLSSAKEMPLIPAPQGLPFLGNYYLGGDQIDIISQSGEYNSFRLTSNAKVTITRDVTLYIRGDFSMRSNTQLEIADGVKVLIYLGGGFVQDSNTKINNLSKDPTKLIVVGTDTFTSQMQWNSNSQFWGAVYVPVANVDFNSNADFCGSIVARSVNSISSNARIHYDQALSDSNLDYDGDFPYIVKSWQEKFTQSL